MESAAYLDVLVAKGKCTREETDGGKILLRETVALLVGLVKSISPDRLHEEGVAYHTGDEG